MRKLSLIGLTLVLAACGGTLGDLGGILGSPSPDQPSEIRGYVDNVDTSAGRIDLDVTYVNQLQESRADQSVYFDNRTKVMYQGREYSPSQLERGDQVAIRGFANGNRYMAETIEVLRDATN